MNAGSSVSASPVIDRVMFGALLLIMLCASPRLLVYNRSMQIGPIRVELTAIDARGMRIELAVPPSVERQKVRATIAGIEAFARTPHARTLIPPGGYLEWTLRYAVGLGQVSTPVERILISKDGASR